ncbi:hypothetical protein BX070DRAFT_224495 [Coemansia spiralis]|nr:hypothetical protein BX070DRAFT_224495 [Coemansia spiralis]
MMRLLGSLLLTASLPFEQWDINTLSFWACIYLPLFLSFTISTALSPIFFKTPKFAIYLQLPRLTANRNGRNNIYC